MVIIMKRRYVLRALCMCVGVSIAIYASFFTERDVNATETQMIKYDSDNNVISKTVTIDRITTLDRLLMCTLFSIMLGGIGMGISVAIESASEEYFWE